MTQLPVLLLALLPQDHGAAPPWQSESLDNGVRVHVAEIADAETFAVFTFLPVGLDGDPTGRAQFAHLAEHMLIRSTDPKRLRVGELQLNGETTNQAMRLESFGPPKQWKESLVRHARWLTAREFDEKVLAREKVRIAGEEKSTVPRGFNHKWATAAWAQIAYGGTHAAVHGDVANATVEQVREYVARHVRLDEAQILVAGPCDTDDVIKALRAEFAKVKIEAPKRVAPAVLELPEPAHRDATWDLDASHYLEWYALPQDCSAVEAEMLAQAVMTGCFQDRAFQSIPGRGLAGAVARGGRRFLLLSANLPEGKKAEDIQTAFRRVLDRAPAMAVQMCQGEVVAARYAQAPDFKRQREQLRNPRFRKLLEANWAMQFGYACTRLGVGVHGVPGAYRSVEAERIQKLAKGCTAKARFSAALTRKTK